MKINRYKFQKLLTVLALGIAYFIFVKFTGVGIPCPVRLMSGGRILCPGCGISRMCLNLSSLDIPGAFRCNPAVFSLIPLWSICIMLWLFDRGEKFLRGSGIFSIAILLSFGVWRNFL